MKPGPFTLPDSSGILGGPIPGTPAFTGLPSPLTRTTRGFPGAFPSSPASQPPYNPSKGQQTGTPMSTANPLIGRSNGSQPSTSKPAPPRPLTYRSGVQFPFTLLQLRELYAVKLTGNTQRAAQLLNLSGKQSVYYTLKRMEQSLNVRLTVPSSHQNLRLTDTGTFQILLRLAFPLYDTLIFCLVRRSSLIIISETALCTFRDD